MNPPREPFSFRDILRLGVPGTKAVEPARCACGARLAELRHFHASLLGGSLLLADDLVPEPSAGGRTPRYGLPRRVKMKGPHQYRRSPRKRKSPVELSLPTSILVYCPSCGRRVNISVSPRFMPNPLGISPPWEMKVTPYSPPRGGVLD